MATGVSIFIWLDVIKFWAVFSLFCLCPVTSRPAAQPYNFLPGPLNCKYATPAKSKFSQTFGNYMPTGVSVFYMAGDV